MGDSESHIANNSAEYFRAFVSYSHADAAAAQKLHRKIETYRLPKSLRLAGIDKPSDGRLGKIFRDREDLPAAQDLSEAVKQALAVSQALIVLCSPDAQASPWVAREIELFRELHPDRPILAAILRGEPEEAFPEPLRQGREPLAADLRKEGDGWRLGLLKIVSGIAEVPLDALVQRDAQRRLRSVMAVTGGALAALLVMIGMTIFAFQQRSEAQHQQAEAEGMVEYMLTDLRTRLKGVGRLDVMTDVNERAMDYYEGQGDLSDMPAESLERRARILHAMGEDDEKRGDLDKALAKFTEAHRVTEALLAQDPDNPDRIFGHAQSEYWVGYVAYMTNNWFLTNKHWSKYNLFADKLVSGDPTNTKWLREAGYASGNLCTLALRSQSDGKEALDICQSATQKMQLVLEAEPINEQAKRDLANRFGWLAEAYINTNNRKLAAKAYRNQETILEALVESKPRDLSLTDQWARVLMTTAELHKDLGNDAVVQEYSERATALVVKLISRDPKNQKWKKWKLRTENILKGNKK